MKKLFALICATSTLATGISGIPVFAEQSFNSEETVIEEQNVRATYLISEQYLSIYKNGSILYIDAETGSNSIMKTIGFKNVTVEYSTNLADWYEYKPPFDYTASSTRSCRMSGYSIPVTNGYYYRVTLNHYAKETGWFGSSQSVPNISNVVS